MEEEQQVEFQCLTASWFPQPDVGWSLNGAPVNSSLFSSSSTPVGDTFTSTSVLTFQARANTTVECWASVAALSSPQASRVFLDVGTERTGRAETSNKHTHTHTLKVIFFVCPGAGPKPPDWTVLIAVVASIGGSALLILLIYGIVFCCRRRKGKGKFPAKTLLGLRLAKLWTLSLLGLMDHLCPPGQTYQDEMM